MAVLAVATFLFPIDNSRALYGITVVLGFAVYQTLIVQTLPGTADHIPLVVYIIFEIVIASLITLYSAIAAWSVDRYSYSGNPLPPRLACLTCTNINYSKQITPMTESSHPTAQASSKIVRHLETQRIENACSRQWLSFFHKIDSLMMIFFIAVSIALPMLVFYTNVFKESSKVSSPVPTNYVENYYQITTQTQPATLSTSSSLLATSAPWSLKSKLIKNEKAFHKSQFSCQQHWYNLKQLGK